jgi:hypothetical protein
MPTQTHKQLILLSKRLSYWYTTVRLSQSEPGSGSFGEGPGLSTADCDDSRMSFDHGPGSHDDAQTVTPFSRAAESTAS